MKKRSLLKKYRIIAIISSLVILISLSLFLFGGNLVIYSSDHMYESEEQVLNYFNSEPYSEFMYDLESYSSDILKIDEEANLLAKDINKDLKKAKNISPEYESSINNINSLIEKFFEDTYSISVHEKMSKLIVKQCKFSNENIGGLFDGANTIYISEEYIYPEITEKDAPSFHSFYNFYIHEAIHYLGINWEEDSLVYLLEGIAECLTEDIFLYYGYDYANETSYVENKMLARQLMIADKTFVTDLISAETISDQFLNQRIDLHYIPGTAKNINDAFKLLMNFPNNFYFKEISQHLIGEYCKNFTLTDEEKISIAEYFVAELSTFQ